MAKDLADACAALETLISGVTGISTAGTISPENITTFPFVITYPSTGEWIAESYGVAKGLHTLIAEIHSRREDFPTTKAALIEYGEAVKNALLGPSDVTLTDTVEGINRVGYSFGPLGYGFLDTYGWSFEIDVKIINLIP